MQDNLFHFRFANEQSILQVINVVPEEPKRKLEF